MVWPAWSAGDSANDERGGAGKQPGEKILWSHRISMPGYNGMVLTTTRLVQLVNGAVTQTLSLELPFEVGNGKTAAGGGRWHPITFNVWEDTEHEGEASQATLAPPVGGSQTVDMSTPPLIACTLTFDCASPEVAAFFLRAVEHQSRVRFHERCLESLEVR
jgi:hypothetical protein